LESVGVNTFGRENQMTPETAQAWSEMKRASEEANINLRLISGYRSVARQTEIVQVKLDAGIAMDAILRVNAYPGYSEHHTGKALDLGSPDAEHLSETFENTREFNWLNNHASQFGCHLSYPRNNLQGITYEPWHWCLQN
jgi:D-alanyl-D-alanine carboxypeptidase